MKYTEAKQLIEKQYNELHQVLFPESVAAAQTRLIVITEADLTKGIPNLVSAYFFKEDILQIAICEADLEDDSRMKGSPSSQSEPIWKTDLLHEIIHEFQYKCVTSASDDGLALMESARKKFEGNGHDEKFYTAISECAKKLNIKKEALESKI